MRLANFNARKTQLVLFDCTNNSGVIDVKLDRSVLEEIRSFRMLGMSFSSQLDWDSYIASIVKTASEKTEALIRSIKFLSPEFSIIQPCMECCCDLWTGAPSCYLDME